MRVKEVLSVVLIAVVISILSGVVLFEALGIAPRASWNLVAMPLLLMLAIVVSTTLAFYFVFRRYVAERTIRVAMMALKNDEQTVLRKIMELGGEVRQDDLWRKLRDNFKSKLSQLVINLERKKALTRTRYGRTKILKLIDEYSKR